MASVVALGLKHQDKLAPYLLGEVAVDTVAEKLRALNRGLFSSDVGDIVPLLCGSVLKKDLLIFRLDTQNILHFSPDADLVDGPVPEAGAAIMVARMASHYWAVMPPNTMEKWACL